jgi:hypothetical protein
MPSFLTNWFRNTSLRLLQHLALVGFLLLTGEALCQAGNATAPQAAGSSARLLSAIPMAFEENDGQLAPELSYLGRAKSYSVAIERDRLKFLMPGTGADSTIDVRFAGSRGGSPVSLSGVAYRSNYFIGADRSHWREGVANFSRVGIRNIYPGIDTEFYEKDGALEHDFIVAPGGDTREIRLNISSLQSATLRDSGDIVIPTTQGELRFRKPVAYQFDAEGKRVAVPAGYRVRGHDVRFDIGAYDRSRTLVIDPVILFATYIAGGSGSTAAQMTSAVDTTNKVAHLYLTGSVPSVLGFPPPGPTSVPTGITNTDTNVFVAALTADTLGSTIDWITFLGGTGNSTASAIATSGAVGNVFVGGQTTAPDFTSVGGYQPTFPGTTSSAVGFVTSLKAANGTSPASTYVITIDPASTEAFDNTTVTGLAVSNGNVYLSGNGPGTNLTQVNGLGITPVAPRFGGTNAFLIELDSTLSTASLATYVQSETSANYRATGVQVDPSGIVYVSGTTSVSFPTAFGPDYTGCTAATNGFIAGIWPPGVSHNPISAQGSIFGLTAVLCGNAATTANGLALSPDGTQLYLIGDTTSTNLANSIFYSAVTSPVSTSQSKATGLTGLQATASAHHYGYALQILPLNGGTATVLPAPEFIALAYLGDSSGDTTFYAGSFDGSVSANSLLQVAGTTTATSTKLPGAGTATALPSGQDNSAASTQRGLLYTLTSNLAKADAISFFGSSVTQSTVKSVQSDGVGGTYVLVDDSAPGTISNQSASFTSAAAVQGQPPNGTALHYAYIAELLGTSTPKTPAPGLTPATFTADFDNLMINGAPCKLDLACVAANDGSSTISYQWGISPANNAGNVVFNFAAQSELGPTYTIALDGQQANTSGSSLSCVTAQANNGTTCTAPSITAAGSPHTLTLAGKVPSGASTNPITFDGNVADAAGEFVDAKQNQVLIAAPVNIKANITGSTATVDAASSATDTIKHPTVVTYIATVTNQGTTESKYTTLKITLPPAFIVTTLPTFSGVTAPTCDTTVKATGCSSADIPAGGVLTYTFSGVYVGSLLTSTPNADGTFTETVKADASALPAGTNSESSQTTTTTVRGYAALSLDVEPKTSTHNLSTTATPDNVTITITLSNAGPNESGPIPAGAITNTLPATTYFVVSNVTVAAPSGSVCDISPSLTATGCTSLASIPSGGSVIYTITGSFPDNGTNPDAVPPTASSASFTDSATYTSPATTFNPNTPAPQSASITVQRKSDLTLSGAVAVLNPSTPAAPCDKDPNAAACVYMANTAGGLNGPAGGAGINDNPQYTVTVKNAGPNLATTAAVSIPLPPNFLVPITPTSSTGLTCVPATVDSQTMSCTGYVPVGSSTVVFASKFSDTTVPAPPVPLPNPPPTAVKLITTNPAPSSVKITAAVVGANNPSQLPRVTVERAIHLVTLKYVCRSAGIANPALPCPATPGTVNLDEKVANDAPGKNDLTQVQIQVGNTELNQAYGVTVTDKLPSYFILTQIPDPTVAACKLTSNTTIPTDQYGNPMTGDTSVNPVTLTCTFSNPILPGTATPGTNATSHGSMQPGFAQLTYYGKFQDNGLNVGIVPQTGSSIALGFQTAQASSTFAVLADTVGDATSPAPAPLTIQRAAHLRVIMLNPPFTQPNDSALLPAGVAGPGIAEAQPAINGGTPVSNSMRYKVAVVNDGPNIAPHPLLTTALPPNANGSITFAVQGQSLEPAFQGYPGPASCTAGNACFDGGAITPGAQVTFNLDGYFGLNTLTEGNQAARIFNSVLTDSTIVDSNPTGTTNGDGTIPQAPITVVNTPVGSNYMLSPFAGNLAQPLNLQLGTVQSAGVTGLAASGSTLPPLPSGPSPNPPDNGAPKSLYRFGTGGLYYSLGTTAGVPTGSQNSTKLCLTQIPDVFEKPERVLLWALANAPAGTTFNAVPNYTSSGTAGDITVSVLPQTGGSYTVPTAITSYPPSVQAQPAQACGVLNGLSDAANPTTLAVLEPVNYAPYIRTTVVPTPTSQPGKGVTASAAVVDLTISPKNNYDYNDQDPCYTGSDGTQRSTCNDNVQLTTFLFGGQNFIGDDQQQHSYFYGQIPNDSMPQFNIPAGLPQIYVLLTDQVGAQHYQNVGTDPTHPIGCDPGTTTASYTPAPPFCTDKPALTSAGVTVPPVQAPLTDNPSAQVALVTGSVGFGGSTGLIVITQTPEAIAHITAGQTAGFVWNSLTEDPLVQGTGGNPPVFTLACVSADGTNLASVGITCNVPQTYTYSTGSGNTFAITQPPTVYVVTTSNTAVGALHEAPLSRDLQIFAAIVFPVGAIPLVLLLRRRKTLRRSGWLAVLFLASLVGLGIGCGSSNFKNMGGTTTTATPAGTYELMVTATSGSDMINSPKFAVTVSAVH